VKRLVIAVRLLALPVLLCQAQLSPVFAQTIEIPTCRVTWNAEPVRLEISRRRHCATLYCGELSLRTFPVAVGRPGWETPLGNFQVIEMIRDPAWKHPLTRKVFEPGAAGNELGHYWIGFWTNGETSIGLHGTPHPESVGKSVSHGCVRMRENDIQELFAQVNVGTLVSVLP
jgi:lipoprotein-anchoring transpeptidase ErfK/SrfK